MKLTFPIIDTNVLLHCIPQRHPFVLVDCLYHFKETQVTAGITITVEGLFVKDNELKEPGLIEHMAQSVALHTGFSYYEKNMTAPVGYIGSISNLKILRLPKVGESIITDVLIIQEFSGITMVEMVSKIDNEIIATGQMKTVIA